ncbi:MAG: hypothetical protein WC860_06390 [Candidatus Margulisiibacteriota bacterium]|jgi:hypothetical protein
MDNKPRENLKTGLTEKFPEKKPFENNYESELKNFEIKPAPEVNPLVSPATPTSENIKNPVILSQPQQEIADLEEILSSGLDEIYQELSPENKTVFKVKGEAAANKIQLLMQTAKIKFNDILEIIRNWLLVIPGVNRFFLEQEAKIKTDKIISWHDHTHHQ